MKTSADCFGQQKNWRPPLPNQIVIDLDNKVQCDSGEPNSNSVRLHATAEDMDMFRRLRRL